MAVTSIGKGTWKGSLEGGAGTATLASTGLASLDVNWKARAEGGEPTTTPEELLGAAHAACYAMALSHTLGGKGYTAESIETSSAVTFQPGQGITGIALSVTASVPGLSKDEFAQIAEEVKSGCPVSAALSAVPMTLASVELQS